MNFPIVICDGMIRSGSTWSFNVCRLLGILHAKRLGQPVRVGYYNLDALEEFLQNGVLTGNGPMVIKAHQVGPVAQAWIRAGKALAVCTVRDPRDCVASDIPFWGAGFDASVQRVANSLNSMASACQDLGRTLVLRYEEMMEDRHWQIKRIAAHLKIDVDHKAVDWIDSHTNVEASRKFCEQLKTRSDKNFAEFDGHRCDSMTLLHDNHIGTAKTGRWREDLTAEQVQAVSQVFQSALHTLGYECETPSGESHPASEVANQESAFNPRPNQRSN